MADNVAALFPERAGKVVTCYNVENEIPVVYAAIFSIYGYVNDGPEQVVLLTGKAVSVEKELGKDAVIECLVELVDMTSRMLNGVVASEGYCFGGYVRNDALGLSLRRGGRLGSNGDVEEDCDDDDDDDDDEVIEGTDSESGNGGYSSSSEVL